MANEERRKYLVRHDVQATIARALRRVLEARASHPLELARLVVMLRHARMLRRIDTEFLPRRG